MEPAIMKAFEIGVHMAPVAFGSVLCPMFWGCLTAGGLVQLLLRKKARSAFGRWAFAGVLGIGLLICEIACQVMTGWDLIVPIVLYFYLLTMLAGAGACALVCRLRKGAVP